ncbi:MFS transporter [Streptomyces sp. NPDC001315]|uniref:MFS transporter n=1 Tax=Streptomyces sp. NPDC001315 TaxID=3364562 RepID=UPI0036AF221E
MTEPVPSLLAVGHGAPVDAESTACELSLQQLVTTPPSRGAMSAISPVPSQSAQPQSGSRHITVTIVLACMGVFISYLPVVGVSVALPVMQQALDASTAGLQWITDAFILPTAALLLTCGMIGDLYGRKKTWLAGLVLFSLGCLVCLTADGVVQVCVGQALTGVGTAALLPSTLALISHVCPDRHKRARAIALWTASLGLGLTLGPLFNGLIVEHVSWRWIFLPALVMGLVTAAVGGMVLTESRAQRERHLDIGTSTRRVDTVSSCYAASSSVLDRRS